MYLENVNGPGDIKKLQISELQGLADEVRETLIRKLSATGGHVGSNLGVVEMTVALHYAFESPKDKLVWDVSHQCYPHKILTGRKEAYTDPAHYKDVTGFTNPAESEHDLFCVGHTSTSVSLALGLAKGRDACGGTEHIVAVIGDGALSGGEALEGLNYAGEYGGRLMLVINDNEQSVAENHGGLYKNLADLRESGGNCTTNLFRGFGLDYEYLEDGHDIEKLIALFERGKKSERPIVLHVHTVKGKGLPYALDNREDWHSRGPFNIEDGYPKGGYPVYDTTIHDSLAELLTKDESAIVLTAGTPRALGFVGEDRERWAKTGRFVDVGIAEENALAMASGVAGYGACAVFGVYAPFVQRAYDQISHDLCLNCNPATILVLLPGVYGMKSSTHLGLCDIQMLSHIPNLVYLSPSCKEEYRQMLRYATTQKKHPTAIRVPVRFYESGVEDTADYSILNKAKVISRGSGACIIAVGSLIKMAEEIAASYKKETDKDVTVVNPVFLTGVDEELLESLKADHSLVVTLEDGELDGGYGQRIASYYGADPMKVRCFGISKRFHSDFNADELLAENGISVENIKEIIKSNT
ncbi:MAG: 1-deoxy-D-xylulose-5-phosphate synthase [Ruminococcaceae bacterium]|nr:1-deoxy-D-xylulose-5-phosphate synthase [Oscillospiraceae bacterium]